MAVQRYTKTDNFQRPISIQGRDEAGTTNQAMVIDGALLTMSTDLPIKDTKMALVTGTTSEVEIAPAGAELISVRFAGVGSLTGSTTVRSGGAVLETLASGLTAAAERLYHGAKVDGALSVKLANSGDRVLVIYRE